VLRLGNRIIRTVLTCFEVVSQHVMGRTKEDNEICYSGQHNKILIQYFPNNKQNKQTPWSESASELYRLSGRRLSAK
jgi:hypothetical protein